MTVDPDKMATVAGTLPTVSAKIRALGAAGYARADIARFLGKRYQHVRNVLEDDAQRGAGGGYVVGRADLSGIREDAPAFDHEAEERTYVEPLGDGTYRLTVRADGCLVLPKAVAESLKAAPGAVLLARLEGDEFNLMSAAAAFDEAVERIRRYLPEGFTMEQFLAEKDADTARETARHD